MRKKFRVYCRQADIEKWVMRTTVFSLAWIFLNALAKLF